LPLNLAFWYENFHLSLMGDAIVMKFQISYYYPPFAIIKYFPVA